MRDSVLIGALRYFVSKLMRSSSQSPDPKIIKGQVIVKARNLRAAANFIPANFSNEGRFEMVVALSNSTNGPLNANERTGKEVESILTGQVSKDNTNKVLALAKEDL